MPKKKTTTINWAWLEPRLAGIKAAWLEDRCEFNRGKINDVKRGKVSLSPDELARVQKALRYFQP